MGREEMILKQKEEVEYKAEWEMFGRKTPC